MLKGRNLRVAVDCRVPDIRQGVGTATIVLAKALSESTGSGQEYTFIVREEMVDWLRPYVYGPSRIVGISDSKVLRTKAAFRRIAPLRYLWHKVGNGIAHIPASDGYIEDQQFDLVHFPTQMGYLTDVPSIYQPWDLQHLHYPQFFSKTEYEKRERLYRAFCEKAAYICVQSNWTRNDLMERFGLAADKIVTIPWTSVFDAYRSPSAESVHATLRKYRIPAQFFFYPAATWPHKNHEVILRALQILKSEEGIVAQTVFSGSAHGHRAVLDKLATELDVAAQVTYLGFLPPDELQAVFGSATAMIFASKFEGFGLPVLEAFDARVPVICSDATTLPEIAGDGAFYFDPDSPRQLAQLMKRMLYDPEARKGLIDAGSSILSRHSTSRMADQFRALYEKVSNRKAVLPGLEEVTGH